MQIKTFVAVLGIAALFGLPFCAQTRGEQAATSGERRGVDRVLVVRNDDSLVSRAVADDYCHRRGVANVVAVHCQDSAVGADKETISFADYEKSIELPIRAFLASHSGIDFIVLTKGVPIRITDSPLGTGKRSSLDSFLAAMDYDKISDAVKLNIKDSGFTGVAWANRFWDSHEPFSHAKFGGYLVTRLDGYTEADAKMLTTRAIECEKHPPMGSILLDTCPDFGYADAKNQPEPLLQKSAVGGKGTEIGELNYNQYNADMSGAAAGLKTRGVPVELDLNTTFVGERAGLMGYTSWGSNDRHFDARAYHLLRFAPGAICETAVSTSARTFLPTRGGQSLIADLIAQGATGVKGYTDEPLLQAIASPTILFDRYTHGWTLAESYYASSRFVGWEDIVVGDPICRAYPLEKSAPAGEVATSQPHGDPQHPVIDIWPGVAPGSEDWKQTEVEYANSWDHKQMVRNVSHPTLTAYFPDPAKANGTAVIIAPGGGFRFLSWKNEGTAVAEWLAERGVTAFVLKYRLFDTGESQADFEKGKMPVQIDKDNKTAIEVLASADGRQAMKIVRQRAAEWKITPNRIGIMGFSAGGVVTMGVVMEHDADSRPDFAAPIYGAIPIRAVPADAPPLFMVCATDDPHAADASTALCLKWTAAKFPAELHIYAKGGHGFGMSQRGLPVDHWIDRFGEWMKAQGLMK